MKLTSSKSSMLAKIAGATLVVAALPVLTAPSAEAGWTSWLSPSKSYAYSGQNMSIAGKARQHNYGCGLKDCDTVDYVSASARRTSGTYKSNLARVSLSTGFTGLGVSASVSTGAVGLGFSDYGSGCDHGWWTGGKYSASVSFGSSDICQASTWGLVGSVKQSVSAGFRFGTHWEARTATESVKVGGF